MSLMSTRLDFPTYLAHLRTESQRFRDVLADCDPAARVPACPEWDAADLLWHLAEVQWFWGRIIRSRPAGPDDQTPDRPDSYTGTLSFFDESSAELVSLLQSADPDDKAWTWSAEQTVGFTYRRQAHEALIHRLDAEQTAGGLTPLDPPLCADGVAELLGVMYGGCPPWGHFEPSADLVKVEISDTGSDLWVRLGTFTGTDPDDGVSYDEPDLSLVDEPGTEPVAVVSGTAADLDAWLWKRERDTAITVTGDPEVCARFRQGVSSPLN